MNKTVIAAMVAASLLAACSSDDDMPGEPAAAGADPITGLPIDDTVYEPEDNGALADEPAVGLDESTPGEPSTGGSPTALAITEANYDTLVVEAIEFYTGWRYAATALLFPGTLTLWSLPGNVEQAEGALDRQDVCDNGGTAGYSIQWGGSRVTTFNAQGAYDNCLLLTTLIDGEIEYDRSIDTFAVASSGIRAVSDIADVRFSGGVGYGNGNNYGGAYHLWWTASEVDLSHEESNLGFRIENANTEFSQDVAKRTLKGQFTMSGSFSDWHSIAVSTPTPFSGPALRSSEDVPGFETGRMILDAGDGSSITLDLNGDVQDVRVTLVTAEGTDIFDRPWSNWLDPLLRLPGPPQ